MKRPPHGDVRPHQILIDYRERPQLTDYGLGKIIAAEDVETGMIFGSSHNEALPPEQDGYGRPHAPRTSTAWE